MQLNQYLLAHAQVLECSSHACLPRVLAIDPRQQNLTTCRLVTEILIVSKRQLQCNQDSIDAMIRASEHDSVWRGSGPRVQCSEDIVLWQHLLVDQAESQPNGRESNESLAMP